MNSEELKTRKRGFALRIIRLAESLPEAPAAKVIRNQLLRCRSSIGANYRAACRARSKADFVSSSIKTAKGIRANPQSAISDQKSYA